MTQARIELLPKQLQFVRSQAPELGYSGAYGAGKSRALCFKVVARASQPGYKEAIVRKHLVALKATTLKTLLEPEGDLPPVLPPGFYTHNKSEREIRIKGGGTIVYFGMDDPEKIGSYNLSGCAIDEAVELTERDYQQLEGRVRLKGEGITRQLYWAGNPGPPSHFIAKRFGLVALGPDDPPVSDSVETIETYTFENSYLTADYLERMERKTGVDYQRNVLGKWVGSEGLVYDSWDRQVHVLERDRSEFRSWHIAVDDGYTNPFAAILFGEDGDGRLHAMREVYARGRSYQQKVDAVLGLRELDGKVLKLSNVVTDPAAPTLIRAFRDAGLPVVKKVDKSVFEGIQLVQQRLRIEGDGLPRLTVSGACPALAKEFESYEWRERGGEWIDEPKKDNDHALDATRYLVRHLERPRPRFST